MKRPALTWIMFGACSAVAIAVMGWMSFKALELNDAQQEANTRTVAEEKIQLALWRMDSAATQIVAQESAHAYFTYFAFYPAERAYTRMLSEVRRGEVLMPSPLLTNESPYVLLHFCLKPDGDVISPQVPMGNMRDIAEMSYVDHSVIEQHLKLLGDLCRSVKLSDLLRILPAQEETVTPAVAFAPGGTSDKPALSAGTPAIASSLNNAVPGKSPKPLVQNGEPGSVPVSVTPNMSRSDIEYGYRFRNVQQAHNQSSRATVQQQPRVPVDIPPERAVVPSAPVSSIKPERQHGTQVEQQSPTLGSVTEGMMSPVWLKGNLILGKRVIVSGQTYVMGALLDWVSVKRALIESVADLFPEADLIPVAESNMGGYERRLAALPLKFLPGNAPAYGTDSKTPFVLTLAIAWICVVVTALSVGLLLAGAISLSRRRGDFVSAVTNELRTPLTTFKMYSEMLAGGMVAEDKRQEYLHTLCAEADRLGHLVENALAYARLEGSRSKAHIETITVQALLDRVRNSLTARAEHTGMQLVFESEQDALSQVVLADVSAVEQILFNLVDNAGKYASSASDKRIHIEAVKEGGPAVRVRDHGPGIGENVKKRMFQPFNKSAKDAANSAPGVGLGLALSRRLARGMGGDLRLQESSLGACFELILRSGT